MSTLQVREVPEHIYRKLVEKAEADHRSLSQEAIAVLAKGLGCDLSPIERRQVLLQKIRETATPSGAAALLDPVQLVREDRDR